MTEVCQLISRGGEGWQKKNRGKTKSFLCFAAAFMPLPGKSFYSQKKYHGFLRSSSTISSSKSSTSSIISMNSINLLGPSRNVRF